MQIHQIIFESDHYQIVFQKDRSIRMTTILKKGLSRDDIWPDRLELGVTETSIPRGIFYQWSSGELILTREAQADETLVLLLKVNGEFLPVVVDGNLLMLHNIVKFSDCIDHQRSKFGSTTGRVPAQLIFPCFHADKVPLGIHFRLREYPGPRYVATDPSLPPEKDFYQWYHKQGYKGLKFRLLWDSEKPNELNRFY